MLPSIDPKKTSSILAKFIKHTVTSRGFKKVIIAVSGGIDSTISLFLACQALGAKNIYTLQLPYGSVSNTATTDGQLAIKICSIPQKNTELIDIAPPTNLLFKQLGIDHTDKQNRIRMGNIMARMRMITLFDRAKKHSALVLGTENRSEQLLGYFTRFGDEASDIEPLQHLYKTQIYALARFLGVPEPILTKAPTAELWANQTDEGQFGFTYKVADQILYGVYDQKYTDVQLIKQGFKKADITKVKAWVTQNYFKHEVPYIFKSKKP